MPMAWSLLTEAAAEDHRALLTRLAHLLLLGAPTECAAVGLGADLKSG